MTTRDEFEKWAIKEGYAANDFIADQYPYISTQAAWKAWQARQQEIDALKAEIEMLKDAMSCDQPKHTPNAGHPLLQKLIDSIDVLEGEACWDFMAMFDVRDALNGVPTQFSDASKMILPPDVIYCLRFYGNGEHFYIDPDGEGFDTVSGEPENWLCSQRENDATMFENGGLARAVLCGHMIEGDPEYQPIEGEVYGIAPDQCEDNLNMVPADNQDELDAIRYRWLRNAACDDDEDGVLIVTMRGDWSISKEQAEFCGEVLDATVDAQMQRIEREE